MFETGQFEWTLVRTPIKLKELSADPANSAVPTNTVSLYAKDKSGTSTLFYKDDAGVIHDLGLLPPSAKALTKVDDTNVTLTLGGTPASALLQDVTLTLGWTGALGLARGGTAAALTAAHGGVVYSTASALAISAAGTSGDWLKSAGAATPTWASPAALTKTDDTNVTLTLGGSPTTALLNAASLTLGWTGLLELARGGTAANLSATGGTSHVLRQSSAGAAVTVSQLDHSELTGLTTGDPHTQYALLAGRSGGQVLIGGTAAADDLTLRATAGMGAGSEAIIFQGGNNGATEFGRWARNGTTSLALLIGTTTVPTTANGLVIVNQVAGTRALTCQGDGSGAPNSAFELFVNSTASPTMIFRKGRGTIASPTQTLSADSLGTFTVRAVDNTSALTGDMAKFESVATENITTTGHGSDWRFFTVANGSTTQSERLRLAANGWLMQPEISVDPSTSDLSADAAIAVYNKNDKFVIAYNNGGTITYVSIPLDGATTTWTHNTTAP